MYSVISLNYIADARSNNQMSTIGYSSTLLITLQKQLSIKTKKVIAMSV